MSTDPTTPTLRPLGSKSKGETKSEDQTKAPDGWLGLVVYKTQNPMELKKAMMDLFGPSAGNLSYPSSEKRGYFVKHSFDRIPTDPTRCSREGCGCALEGKSLEPLGLLLTGKTPFLSPPILGLPPPPQASLSTSALAA